MMHSKHANRRGKGTWLLALLVCAAFGANAQDAPDGADDTDFELTITLLPRGTTVPEAVTRRIELPPAAAERAGEGRQGLDTANEARERRTAAGLETAGDAIERGREFGQAMREQAAEARENAGRGERPDPPNPPDRPEPPRGPPVQ